MGLVCVFERFDSSRRERERERLSLVNHVHLRNALQSLNPKMRLVGKIPMRTTRMCVSGGDSAAGRNI